MDPQNPLDPIPIFPGSNCKKLTRTLGKLCFLRGIDGESNITMGAEAVGNEIGCFKAESSLRIRKSQIAEY